MRFHALAVDFDGTLAHDSQVAEQALEALRSLRKSGRRSILATGRILDDLRAVYENLELFDAIVAENGAVLFDPASGKVEPLAPPPPEKFVEMLRARGVAPLEVGHVIVATWQPHEQTVLDVIRELGLDLSVIFNKGAVMVLPSGVNKATGLEKQLEAFKLSFHNIAGIGDAENDLRFLERCEASAAVANALDSVKERCDLVMEGDHGHGVCQFIERIVEDDLVSAADTIDRRHRLLLGKLGDGVLDVSIASRGILIAGTSGGGKSTMASALIERIAEAGYQFTIMDPEGDFAGLEGAIAIGDADSEPNLTTVDGVISSGQNSIISLVAIKVDDRAVYARQLFSRIAELRVRFGRPHWLIVDEAHHFFPAAARASSETLEPCLGVLYTTTEPQLVASEALTCVDVVVAMGEDPRATIDLARKQLGVEGTISASAPAELRRGEALVWRRSEPETLLHIETIAGKSERRRHARKYAKGELTEEKSFYFTGPKRKLKLRAQNLFTFVQMAEGVDDETWTYHLRRHDYSGWVREMIGDDDLAAELRATEDERKLSPGEGRKRIAEAVRVRYTVG